VSVGAGFVELRRWPVRVLVRAELADSLGEWLLERRVTPPADATRFATGRGGTWAFSLPDGRRAVFREYRRGGWLARVVRRSYLGFEARPFREVAVAARAWRRGVPTAEVLAARVIGRVLYRGAIVTALIPGATPALDALRAAATEADRLAIASAVGHAVGEMHRLGLVHPDLNCQNLLVAPGPDGVVARVIDLDRASLVDPPVGVTERASALARLGRSLRKLDPEGRLGTEAARGAFRAGYEEAAHLPCAC
jgi:3-deoxy-D-manno-octulosonic acid kinase